MEHWLCCRCCRPKIRKPRRSVVPIEQPHVPAVSRTRGKKKSDLSNDKRPLDVNAMMCRCGCFFSLSSSARCRDHHPIVVSPTEGSSRNAPESSVDDLSEHRIRRRTGSIESNRIGFASMCVGSCAFAALQLLSGSHASGHEESTRRSGRGQSAAPSFQSIRHE